jgi:hypothetical protein
MQGSLLLFGVIFGGSAVVGCRSNLIDAPDGAYPCVAPPPNGALVADCPTSPPDAGAPCARAGLDCEWGDDPDSSCNTVARCEADCFRAPCPMNPPYWHTSAPGAQCPSAVCSTPDWCPASFEEASSGGPCMMGLTWFECRNGPCPFCGYRQGVCRCDKDEHTGDSKWACTTLDPSCPPYRPRLGSSCAGLPNVLCSYTADGSPPSVGAGCRDGVWHE